MESLQKVMFSTFVVISSTNVSVNRSAIKAPMSSSLQIYCDLKGATQHFPAIRLYSTLYSTVSSVNARLRYAHEP